MKRALLVAFAVVMLIATFPALAGDIRRLDLNANNYDIGQKYRIVISNAAAQLIDFQIAGKDGGMQKYEVAAGDVATLRTAAPRAIPSRWRPTATASSVTS